MLIHEQHILVLRYMNNSLYAHFSLHQHHFQSTVVQCISLVRHLDSCSGVKAFLRFSTVSLLTYSDLQVFYCCDCYSLDSCIRTTAGTNPRPCNCYCQCGRCSSGVLDSHCSKRYLYYSTTAFQHLYD